ncbi:MAG: ribonuclease III [Clostridia bacterium]|nr:ribonuclease III [Clostridia bacterium]
MKLSEKRYSELNRLQGVINYSFNDPELLNNALTHTSYVKGENRNAVHNERLEFLGDAVLELIVSEYLFVNNPQMNEGLMTRVRSRAVYENALFDAAREIDLGRYLLLSHGEEHTGGREKPSILSDALEALIGAMYLDGGIEPAKKFILGFAVSAINEAVKTVTVKDYKTLLQEYIQQNHAGSLEYNVVSISGPDHKRVFTMEVCINGMSYGRGQGGSKQEAGQNAAHATLLMLGAVKPEHFEEQQ